METRHVEALEDPLDRLRLELAQLRASRKRLVLAADADRRKIERDLHDGLQQELVALAVNLQLAGRVADADPAATKGLIEEMERDVQRALADTARLAERIYPSLPNAGGLAAALRSAAASAGIPASVEVTTTAGHPADVVSAVYLCCLEALEHAAVTTRATVRIRDDEAGLAFEVVGDGGFRDEGLERLRDRVEALGGRLTMASEPGRGTRVSGSFPLSR